MEHAIVAFARPPNGGLIIVGAPSVVVHRHLIITLAARIAHVGLWPFASQIDVRSDIRSWG